ncbi:MAG: dihydrodipicolinate synthase family protein [Planctomycetota bacterium]|nr:dihydrodipicolinate synthase family protein [Planctomycetota bacterium]
MDTRSITPARLAESVIAVPPLARNASHSIDTEQNRQLVQYIEQGGVSTLLYGGNAIFYHIRPSEYARILQMLTDVVASSTLVVPAVGPAFGTMMDQAEILQDFDFPTVMLLPQSEVTDPAGIASGVRKFAEAFGKPVVLYLKHDQWLPAETVGKMFRSGLLSWIKYAVVRKDPREDEYLREVLAEVPGELVVSGIGEQPAIVHMHDFQVGSFTSGCVCVNPSRSMKMLRAIQVEQLETAEEIRASFEGLEDLRNRINPIRVLHRAVELAEIAETGPMTPMLGELSPSEVTSIATAALSLKQL